MKLRLGSVPESRDFHPAVEGFVPLREPSDGAFLAASIPVSFVLLLLLAWAWSITGAVGWHRVSVLDLAFAFFAMIVLHEWSHALTLPDQGAGEHTLFGFSARHLTFYTHYDGEIEKERFLVTLLSPFVLLSLAPLAFGSLFGIAPSMLALVSLLNGMGAADDVLGFFFILFAVPKNAILRNQGPRTWWHEPAEIGGWVRTEPSPITPELSCSNWARSMAPRKPPLAPRDRSRR